VIPDLWKAADCTYCSRSADAKRHMNNVHKKFAKMLRTEPEVLFDLEQKMNQITGKEGIIEKIIEENELLIKRTLQELGMSKDESIAEDIYDALVGRLTEMDKHLYEFLDKPDLRKMSPVCGKFCEVARQINESGKGFFIKKEKAIEMLEKFPPQNLLDHFGHQSVGELVEKEGFASVFASLRFVQDNNWMHKFFEEAYTDLTANDFEERDVEIIVLDTKWLDIAEKFSKKKYHHVSHLKEHGIIFITPFVIDVPGETMRPFTLLLHYLNEVPFYSKLFRKFAQGDDFVKNLQ